MNTHQLFACLFAPCAFVTAASAQIGADKDVPIPLRVADAHLEEPDRHTVFDAQLVGPQRVSEPVQITPLRGGSLFLARQVNVNAMGQNIIGDAANEPSLAIDPTAPNRVVVGWRQFDSVLNSFREGGYGYSVDGGRSWTVPPPHENGVFRSDPVLDYLSDGTLLYCSLFTSPQFGTDFWITNDGGVTWTAPMFSFGGDKQWIAVDRTTGIGEGHVYQSWSTAGNPYFPNQFNRSVDGGCTWENPIEINGRPIWGTLEVGPDGTLYIAGWSQSLPGSPLIVTRSTDAQDAGVLNPSFVPAIVDLQGFITVATGPNPQGLLGQLDVESDHSGGVNDGNVYLLGSVAPNVGPDPMEIRFSRSIDGGVNWSSPITINDDAPGTNAWQWFAAMDVAPNGRIDVVWYDTRNDTTPATPATSEVWYAYSNDGGLTFSANERLTVAFQHALGYPQQNKLGDYIDLESDDVGAHVCIATTWNGGQDVWYLRLNDYDCDANGVGDSTDIALDGSLDCNANGILDSCETAAGGAVDANANGVPDECECDGDVNGDGAVDSGDIGYVIFRLGNSGAPGTVDGDANGDGVVDAGDIAYVIFRLGALCASPS